MPYNQSVDNQYENNYQKNSCWFEKTEQSMTNNSGNTQGQETNTQVDPDLRKLASEVIDLVNAERSANGLNTLETDLNVQSAAQVRTQKINTVFSHTRPNGTGCFTALQKIGANYKGAGENIASGRTSAQQVMSSWINSEGHRANILNAPSTKIEEYTRTPQDNIVGHKCLFIKICSKQNFYRHFLI